MMLRTKVLAVIGLTLLCLMAALYALSGLIITHAFSNHERTDAHQNMRRVLNSLHVELAELDSTTKDWAYWDDTYWFVQERDPAYVASNLAVAGTYENNRLNLLLLLDASGRVVEGRAYDLQSGEPMPVPADLYAHLGRGSPLLRHTNEVGVVGLLELRQGLLMVSAQPVLTSEGAGPPAGTLIFGRLLNDAEIVRLSRANLLPLALHDLNDPRLPQGLVSRLSASTAHDPIEVRPASEQLMEGYALLRDVYGEPVAVLRADLPRVMYAGGKTTLLYFMLALTLAGIVFVLVTLILLNRLVLARLAKLNTEVSRVAAEGNPGARVWVPGDDELGQLARQINHMLEATEQSRKTQQATEQRYRRLFEHSLAGVYRTTEDGRILDCNQAMARIFGYPSCQELMAHSVLDLFYHPNDRQALTRTLQQQGSLANTELLMRRRDGTPVWVLDNIHIVEWDEANHAVYEGTLIDITDRKLAEMALADSERKYRHLIEQASDGIAILDARGNIVEANSRAHESLGYSQGELVGINIRDLMLTPTGQEARRSFAQLLSGELLMMEVVLRRRDGSTFHVELTAKRLSDGRIQAIARDITERKRLQERLAYQAYHDPLTQLPNRAMLMERLERAFVDGAAGEAGAKLALLFLDLDDFKVVNDTLGHRVGDQLLVEVARRLCRCVRDADMVARLGGDEFTLLLEGTDCAGQAAQVADRVLACLYPPVQLEEHSIAVSASIGIALSDQANGDPGTLLRNADVAMYAAKGQGKARYSVYEPGMEAHMRGLGARARARTGIGVKSGRDMMGEGSAPDPVLGYPVARR
jgi:diguanylate cyclase (GGDEF)-like protein/PAS domain S-box-containing protein